MKTRTSVFFGVLTVLVVLAVPAFAAETGNAAGRVFDLATNAGVEGVAVVATCSVQYDEDEPYSRVETTTGADGSYTLSRLLAGRTYGLSFAKPGYIVEARWEAGITPGKTYRVAAIALCPIPVAHGVYRLTDEGVQFLQRFLRDSSVRPSHPLTYELLPQATYTKTPVPGKEGEFTRTFTVSRETVIPQILHKHERSSGEPLMVLCDASYPGGDLRGFHEATDSGKGVRRFCAENDGYAAGVTSVFDISGSGVKVFIFYTGVSSVGGSGFYNLGSGIYAVIFRASTSSFSSFSFEIVDTVSGDDVTKCRNILTIMRHEITAFREHNGRRPTSKEVCGFAIYMFNPFVHFGCQSVDADALNLKKGSTYIDPDENAGWLYSPSTGELWPASASGNGEAGW